LNFADGDRTFLNEPYLPAKFEASRNKQSRDAREGNKLKSVPMTAFVIHKLKAVDKSLEKLGAPLLVMFVLI
jgi:hypothetical protein